MRADERTQFISRRFIEAYGSTPTVWVQAPGRVDLMGSHTDYNEGLVLTLAIDRNTWIAARPRKDHRVSIRSLNAAGTGEFSLEKIAYDAIHPWTNYVRGVAAIMQEEGFELQGFDGLIHSTVPFGSGLSSSAALEVSTAVLFDLMSGLNIDRIRMAQLCQRAENEFVGMNCGILDQYSSLLGRADNVLLLDCRDLSNQITSISPGIELIICDTRHRRELTGSEYAERRAQCEEGVRILSKVYPGVKALRDIDRDQLAAPLVDMPDAVARRCRFIIEENRRVSNMAAALANGNREDIRKLTAESYDGALRLYEICTPEMEQMMAAMLVGPGIVGARQAGAGFGGCMVALIEQGQASDFSHHVWQHYREATGIDAEVYAVKSASGAGMIRVEGK
jgi:galactokinase